MALATFDAASVRQYIESQGLKREDVPTPFWPDVDGHIALQDMPADRLINLSNSPLVKNDQGQLDVARMTAVLLCYSLIVKDTGELIFPISLTDFGNRDVVEHLGGSVLLPVFQQAQKFFGLSDENATEAAKQAFLQSLSGGSGTSSPPPLVPPSQTPNAASDAQSSSTGSPTLS